MLMPFRDDKTEFMKLISGRGRIYISANVIPECLTCMTYHLPRTPLTNMSLPC